MLIDERLQRVSSTQLIRRFISLGYCVEDIGSFVLKVICPMGRSSLYSLLTMDILVLHCRFFSGYLIKCQMVQEFVP